MKYFYNIGQVGILNLVVKNIGNNNIVGSSHIHLALVIRTNTDLYAQHFMIVDETQRDDQKKFL